MSEPVKPLQRRATSGETNQNSSSDEPLEIPTSTDPRLLSAYRARASKILRRVAAARQKGEEEKQLVIQRADLLAEKEVQTQLVNESRKDRRESLDKVRTEHRSMAKERAKQYQDNKNARVAEERARNQYMGGVAWGFDPSAGARTSERKQTAHAKSSAHSAALNCCPESRQEVDDAKALRGQRCNGHGRWGIEHGGPGRDGKYAYTSEPHKE